MPCRKKIALLWKDMTFIFLEYEDVCMHKYAYIYTHMCRHVCIYSYVYGQVYAHSDMCYANDKHLSVAAVWQCCAHLVEPIFVKL